MLEILILLTGLLIVGMTLIGLRRTRDPLSPMMAFAPTLLYMYVYRPWTVVHDNSLSGVFPDLTRLELIHYVTLATLIAFCVGCVWERRPRNGIDRRFVLLPYGIGASARRKLMRLAVLMGAIGSAAFWFMVSYSGGWSKVFAIAKPFLSSPSGYVGELPMLVYPALLLLAVAWQGKPLGPGRVLVFLAIASPQLIMATFGGRRGPMFLSICSLLGCWCIVRSRRPRLTHLMIGAVAMGVLMLALGRHRGDLFRPWSGDADLTMLTEDFAPAEITLGEEYVCAAATILTCEEHQRHYWGIRYFVTIFVRPIPKQFWRGKYSDFGLGWMETEPGLAGFSTSDWVSAVGFVPAEGNAGGFVADLFLEFSWGGVLVAFLIGRFYSLMWKRWILRGGLSTILYLQLLILSVYLPSQSVGAWAYRLILLLVPTWLIWRSVVEPKRRSRHRDVPDQFAETSLIRAPYR